MFRFIKKIFRDFFTFSKAEQYGVIALLFLILIFTVIYFSLSSIVERSYKSDKDFINRVDKFMLQQRKIQDSIEIERIQSIGQLSEEVARQKIHPFPFNPNMLSKEKWKKLGLTDRQIKIIKNYEAKGGKFYTKEDLKKLYCISDAEYKLLEPYIIIKPLYLNNKVSIISSKRKIHYKLTELNSADTTVLMNNLKMPVWVAKRIIRYRNKLGGFYDKKQLLEVYGMKEKYYKPISRFVYADTTKIAKLCINNIGFKQLLKHPYFDYALTKRVFKERDNLGGAFANINQILNIVQNDTLKNKLSHYLYICPTDTRNN